MTGEHNKQKIFNPKVSIIIPVYNGSNYMCEAIDSALSQSYKNLEVVVVNDGSTDEGKTEEIAKSYGDKIRYLFKGNGGVATALNLGVREMTGEYFSWLSHDDVYYQHKIEIQVQYLQKLTTQNVILYSDYDIIDIHSYVIDEVTLPHYEPERFLYELIQAPFLHGCTLLIPKLCFDKVGLFNEKLQTTQDYELWVKMAKEHKFFHIPEKLIQVRHHAGQGINKIKTVHFQEVDELNIWFLKNLPFDNIPEIYHVPISKFYRQLAKKYKQRGLMKAYCRALDKGTQTARTEGSFSYLKMRSFIQYEIFKRHIKQFLYFLK